MRAVIRYILMLLVLTSSLSAHAIDQKIIDGCTTFGSISQVIRIEALEGQSLKDIQKKHISIYEKKGVQREAAQRLIAFPLIMNDKYKDLDPETMGILSTQICIAYRMDLESVEPKLYEGAKKCMALEGETKLNCLKNNFFNHTSK